ncbi:MAG: winged helix-turn-helix domain-containing protein [Chloroflexi bacterium]|nr:winged helix-turn-helix domain-containing protein [Chloroflexota bacterium]
MSRITIAKSKRRGQLGIVADILDIAQQPALKTQIMYKANLSFTQLNDYLSFLLNTKLIKQTRIGGKEVYTITAAGVNFLQKHEELILMLKSNDLKNIEIPVKSLAKKPKATSAATKNHRQLT